MKIMPLVAPTPQLRLRWTELSWSVRAERGKNSKFLLMIFEELIRKAMMSHIYAISQLCYFYTLVFGVIGCDKYFLYTDSVSVLEWN